MSGMCWLKLLLHILEPPTQIPLVQAQHVGMAIRSGMHSHPCCCAGLLIRSPSCHRDYNLAALSAPQKTRMEVLQPSKTASVQLEVTCLLHDSSSAFCLDNQFELLRYVSSDFLYVTRITTASMIVRGELQPNSASRSSFMWTE